MARRFTVIQGGLSLPVTATGTVPSASTGREDATEDWRVDLHRAGTVDDAAVAAWRALMTRNAVADPLQDPDYLLTLARHQPAGGRIAFALAWNRDAHGGQALHGVLPLVMPHPVWGRARAHPWQPHGQPDAASLIDGDRSEAVNDAVRGRLRSLRRPVTLDDAAQPSASPGAQVPTLVASSRPVARGRTIPADSLVGVRPQDYQSPGEIERIREPVLIRDAVETFLALDARSGARPIVADPSEAAMVRVVSRLFARRRQMSVEFARRAGEVVAGTLHLGAGPHAVAWRHAAQG